MQDFSIRPPSPFELQRFRENVYVKYLDTVNKHLVNRCPDIDLLEAFSMFDGKNWPEDSHLLQGFGNESLSTLTNHFSPALIDADAAAYEWEIFKNSAIMSEISDSYRVPFTKTNLYVSCVIYKVLIGSVCADSCLLVRCMNPWQLMSTLIEKESLRSLFPNLFKLALIALLIPASTADYEREFLH